MTVLSSRDLYDRTALVSASAVISRYSTSFSGATRLLGPRVRGHVRAIYALVRVVDEIVDGPGRESINDPAELRALVDDVEAQTLEAIRHGFSPNLIIHAFAQTAIECGIGEGIIHPFFDSMRVDIDTTAHTSASHQEYVYGSAEVVGLMCLQVFVNADRPGHLPAPAALRAGARRLGAAFQDINFLRDGDYDRDVLGRNYLNSDDDREQTISRIRCDLAIAARTISDLPIDCRAAVSAAHDLFASLCDRIENATPGDPRRIRVPNVQKAAIIARCLIMRRPSRGRR